MPVQPPQSYPPQSNLYSAVDRVLLNRPDCAHQPGTKCNCATYKPTIDTLSACQSPSSRAKREISFEDYALNSAAAHGMNQFYDRTKPLEHMLMDAEAANAIFHNGRKQRKHQQKPAASVVDERRMRLKKFFQSLISLPTKSDVMVSKSNVSKRAPLPYAMRPNDDQRSVQGINKSVLPSMRERWAKIFAATRPVGKFADQRIKRDVVLEMLSKQDAIGQSYSEHSNPLAAQKRIRKQCPTCGSLRHVQCNGRPQPHQSQRPLSAASRPIYVEYVQGEPVPYAAQSNAHQLSAQEPQQPQEATHHNQQRYVFDQMGHRYVEHNGKLRLVEPQPIVINEAEHDVGSAQYQPPTQYTDVLEDILDHNQAIIKGINLKDGHMVTDPVDLTVDTLNFLHEFTDHQRSSNPQEAPATLPSPSAYQTRPPPPVPQYNDQQQQYHQQQPQQQPPPPYPGQLSKRSFAITPLLQDQQDGSVLVKISPRKHKKYLPATSGEHKKATYRVFKSSNGSSGAAKNRRLQKSERIEAKTKFARPAKNTDADQSFEIVNVDANGRPTNAVAASEEDLAVLRYIYESQTKRRKQEVDAVAANIASRGSVAAAPSASVRQGMPPTPHGGSVAKKPIASRESKMASSSDGSPSSSGPEIAEFGSR